MIYLTFYYDRNVFRGHEFAGWIKKHFKSVKFEGFECGRYLPTISVSLVEFEAGRSYIPARNLVRVEGRFSELDKLLYGVRDFRNEIDYSPAGLCAVAKLL